MNNRRFNADKIFWGLCFLAGAVVLIASNSDYLNNWPNISFFQVIVTILFIWMLIKGLVHLDFGEILFSIAFLACIYDEELGITNLTPWPVLGAALLGTIGLGMIFPKKHHWHVHSQPKVTPDVIDVPDDKVIHFENSFGSSIKYINSEDFMKAHLESSFGEMKVYFDNAVIRQGSAQVVIEVSFGNMVLYVPKTWQIIDNTTVSFGSLHVKNPDQCQYQEGNPTLYLSGEVSFGGTEIYYV